MSAATQRFYFGNLFETGPIEISQYTTNPSDVGQFNTVSASFTATKSFVFRIIDESLASSGNDFAIDNLVLTTAVPEPSTWAMIVLGFVGIGAMSCRRRAGSPSRGQVMPESTVVAR
jgi:hypothetical protein